jgi:hypothetical protein
MLRDWKSIQKQEEATRLEGWSVELERVGARSPRLQWRMHQDQDPGPCYVSSQASCVLMKGGCDAHVSMCDSLNDVELGTSQVVMSPGVLGCRCTEQVWLWIL